MGQTLKDVLSDCWGDDWLVGPSSEAFWHCLGKYTSVFNAYGLSPSSGSPGILISEADPLDFLVACLAAWSEGCTVVLANPRWGMREQQQLKTLVNPHWDSPVLAGLRCHPCQVPGGQPGQILLPTGGSSGQIKYAVHTWDTLTASIQGFRDHFGVDQVQAYCVLPLFHVSGLMQALRVLVSGGCLALQSYRDLKSGERLSLPPGGFLSLVPAQLQDLLGLGGEYILWLRSFRAVLLGGAPAGRSLLDQAQAASLPIALTYGMTETASQVATLLPEEFLAGNRSSGRPLPHAQIGILNAQEQPQPWGELGRVVIQASSLAVGYLDCSEGQGGLYQIRVTQPRFPTGEPVGANGICPQESGVAKQDLGLVVGSAHPTGVEPFTTDDVGYLDGAGYLHIVGRSSTKIITGGENVFPEEIEALLLATGWVSDACVVGLPCDRWGQRLCALVVMDSTQILKDLPERLRPLLAPYKLPKQWILTPNLPRTAQGKLSRSQVLALAQRVLGLGSYTESELHNPDSQKAKP